MSYLVNGKGYTFANIQLGLLGNPNVPGFKGIKYGKKVDKKNTKGAGGLPVERTHGDTDFEASITFTKKEVMFIRAAAGNKPLTDIAPFNVTISYANGVDPVKTDVLYDCEFMDDMVDAAEGGEAIKVTAQMVISGIEYGV
jgi:hypothetical protein